MTTAGETARQLPVDHVPSDAEVAAEVRRRTKVMARRYYPVALAAGLLATVVAIFPSTVPAALGANFFASPSSSAARSTGSAGAGTSEAPALSADGAGGSAELGFAAAPGYAGDTGPSMDAGTSSDLYPGEGPQAGTPSADSGTTIPGTGSSSPGGTGPSPSTCPIPVPSTGTPLDTVLSEVSSLCEELSGSRATSASASGAPALWAAVDRAPEEVPYSATGSLLILGVLQGTSVPSQMSATAAAARARGAAVALVLVPDPSAAGGDDAFSSWVTRTVEGFTTPQLVAVGAGAPASATQVSVVASDVVAGLAAAEHAAAPGQHVGLWWGDGGSNSVDMELWHALAQGGGASAPLAASSFVAATLGSEDASCPGLSQFVSAVSQVPSLNKASVLGEMAAGPFPVSPSAPEPGCPAVSGGRDAGVFSTWRLGGGPAPGR